MKIFEELLSKEDNKFFIRKKLYEVTIWDKTFSDLAKEKQLKNKQKYKYLYASEIEKIKEENGDIKILTTYVSNYFVSSKKWKGEFYDEEIIAIPGGGKLTIQYHKGKFITSDNRICKSFDTKILNTKYLYYFFHFIKEKISNFYRGSAIKHPYMPGILNLEIIIPPLSLQEKIVEILDKFSSFSISIQKELRDELNARNKQYKYYLDNIFDTFNLYKSNIKSNKVFEVKLADICKFIRGKRITKKELTKEGYPVVSGGAKYLGYYSNFNREKEQITIAEYGTAGLIQWQEKDFWANDNCLTLEFDEKVLIKKFLYYFLKVKQEKIFESNINSFPQKLNIDFISNLLLKIPSLEKQNKIVDVLDNFESICSSLNISLPTEENKRKEQCEYYKNEIFKYLEVGILQHKDAERERERERARISQIIATHFWRYNLRIRNF
ncbi:restriction modification enzyme subunit S2B [Mycoplasmopsis meleagridis]|uniref:restriction endonuclease subunit S n=2 Tax=Mycoplasmopsis meleagridis TaxID=29561 RepID=UPI001004E962|nr:restriction endonuclease subunit S [Mycoplasmopsis meleagridis]VEU77394.1 restriction modification enzyme subunit S2B [Mycoplasmopsis meleagridis]